MGETHAGDLPAARVLVCFAVPQEGKHFCVPAELRDRSEVLVTGVGQKNARNALLAALARFQPTLVLTCGFAGGLDPDLEVGDVLFSGDLPQMAARLSSLGARPAKFHCAARIAWTAAEKEALWRATGADAVEMESGLIQEICAERGIVCLTIRVISDTAGQDLPLDFNRLMNERLELDFWKLTRAILQSPGRLPSLIRLGSAANRAARSLGHVLEELLGGNGRSSR